VSKSSKIQTRKKRFLPDLKVVFDLTLCGDENRMYSNLCNDCFQIYKQKGLFNLCKQLSQEPEVEAVQINLINTEGALLQ
jgi:hypothetical protein